MATNKSQVALQRFAALGVAGGRLGGLLKTLGPAGIAAGTALAGIGLASTAAYKGMRLVSQGLASIEKEFSTVERTALRKRNTNILLQRLGLGTTRSEILTALRANDSLAMLSGMADGLARRFAVAASPAIIAGVERLAATVRELGAALSRIGLDWSDLEKSFTSGGAAMAAVLGGIVDRAVVLSDAIARANTLLGGIPGVGGALGAAGGVAGRILGGAGAAAGLWRNSDRTKFLVDAERAKRGGALGLTGGGAQVLERGSLDAAKAISGAGGSQLVDLAKESNKTLAIIERNTRSMERRESRTPLRASNIGGRL